ncbi:MAG TPA: hypothetical protein VNV61_03245 [Steroidobacteraceae bacterium]|jgi:hypothetical protein|nr:hypothetical protein [Steroidobacteraceae bacterium]
MHANFEELLNLRDGAPLDAKIAQHVAECRQCTLELEQLRDFKAALRGLPQLSPPGHMWRAIRDDIESAPPGAGNRYLAIGAAALLIAGILVLIQIRYSDRGPDIAADIASPDPDGQRLQRLVTRSQQLEDLLQRLPPRPSVERAATSAAIDDLQTRIQVLDLQLDTIPSGDHERDRAQRLWNARVQLLHSLIDVRYAEALRDTEGAVNYQYSGVI